MKANAAGLWAVLVAATVAIGGHFGRHAFQDASSSAGYRNIKHRSQQKHRKRKRRF